MRASVVKVPHSVAYEHNLRNTKSKSDAARHVGCINKVLYVRSRSS